jgi:hypothetical protein
MPIYGTISPGNSLGFKNVVINGDMSVWQRGTSFTSGDGIYGADRWYSYRPSVTRQSNSDNGGYSLRWAYNSTSTNYLSQGIEGVNCVHLRGKTVTLSFEVKTNTNFNSGRFHYDIVENTGTADQNPNSITQSILKTTATTTSFVRITRTYTLSSSFNNLYVSFTLDSAASGEWYEIRNVQLEEGSLATPFEKRSYGTELQLCQRYYQHLVPTWGTPRPNGYYIHSTAHFKVTMRTSPSLSLAVNSYGQTIGIQDSNADYYVTGAQGSADSSLGAKYNASAEL